MKHKSSINRNAKISSNLNFIKLAFATLVLLLVLALPFVISSFADPRVSLDSRSNAADEVGPIQSWVVRLNGGEIATGNTEIQFFAKNAADANAKFTFTMDLLKGGEFVKNLFTSGLDQQITDRNGIRSKFIDFTGVTEGSDYKLKLTTTDSTGKNTIVDYSDNAFIISANNAQPVFVSTPPTSAINVGQALSYEIVLKDVSNAKILTSSSSFPAWLTYNQNKLSGTPTVAGVYPIVLVAVNDLGRQMSQIFSINVRSVQKTSTPTNTSNVQTPVPTQIDTKSSGNADTSTSSVNIKLPSGDRLSKSDSKIETVLPSELVGRVKKVLVEISRDGSKWDSIYNGNSLSFNLDTSKFDGGDYYLRFTYTFDDDSQSIKGYGPIHIIKQSNDQQSLDVTIRDLKPLDGQQINDTKPIVSATFVKPSGANIDLKSFKFQIDGIEMGVDNKLQLNAFSFTYTPDKEMSYGKHEVKVVIGAEKANPTTKTWSFEIVNKAAEEAKNKDTGVVKRNRILIAVVLGLIILIFLLALWAIALSRKEQDYYLHEEEKKIIEKPTIAP